MGGLGQARVASDAAAVAAGPMEDEEQGDRPAGPA
jgi:hypothetical protein